MTRNIRENLTEILEERERLYEDKKKVSKLLTSFALDGDLDCGLKLLSITSSEERGKEMDDTAENTWALCQRLEKGLTRFLKNPGEVPSTTAVSDNAAEIEHLKRSQKKMKKELEEKEAAIEALKQQLSAH